MNVGKTKAILIHSAVAQRKSNIKYKKSNKALNMSNLLTMQT